MNEKFFELKKEKQDRMINAAIKVFAINGYAHASTDEIVKEAEISKGLLFHYFGSKIGLFSFVYDYSVRYICLELTGAVDKSDNDYFSLHIQLKRGEANALRAYPFMIAFLDRAAKENVVEVMMQIDEKKDTISNLKKEYFKHANSSSFKADVSPNMVDEIIEYTSQAVMDETLRVMPEMTEEYFKRMKDYLILLRRMSYK